MKSCLYFGQVMHARLRPKAHRFRYRVFSAYLDLDELEDIGRRLRLFSYNRPNIFSFWSRDHGTEERERNRPLRVWAEDRLAEAGVPFAGGTIAVLCFPRMFGYVFNPLSLYFCRDQDGSLVAIIYEVHNTFKDRHAYVLPVEPNSDRRVAQQCAKDFYVSPFIQMNAQYSFRVNAPSPDDDRMSVLIRQRVAEGEILRATLSGRKVTLTDRNLARALVLYPLMTVKVMVAIHWEALRLWRKRIPFLPRKRSTSEREVGVDAGRPSGSVRNEAAL